MVAITHEMLASATFGADLGSVEELNLTNKGIHDLGVISQLPSLQELNLAFNNIASLQGLEHLTGLRKLNVSHNQLKGLKGLEGLTGLEQLKISNNKVRQIRPLASCASLQALWLQNNDIRDQQAVDALAGLGSLTHLWLKPNPLASAGPEGAYRAATVAACTALQTLDSNTVTEEERAKAQEMELDAGVGGGGDGQARQLSARRLSSGGSSGVSYGKQESQGESPALQRTVSGSSARFGRRSSPVSGQRTGREAKPPAGGSPGAVADDVGISDVLGLLPLLDKNRGKNTASKPQGLRSQSSKTKPVAGRRSKQRPADASPSSSAAASVGNGGYDDPAAAPPAGEEDQSAPEDARIATVEEAKASLTDEIDPQLVAAMALLRQLSHSNPQGQDAPPPTSVKSAYTNQYEATYSKGGTSAVVVRGDGSVRIAWPNGDVALTCEAETMDGIKSFRMYGQYRVSGALAVSFDPQGGGFLQYPGGGIMLMYDPQSGEGSVYTEQGDLSRRWHDRGEGGLSPLTPEEPFESKLDQFMGVRVVPGNGPAGKGKPQLEVYFSCEGVKHRVVHGGNSASHVWLNSDDGSDYCTPEFLSGLTGRARRGPAKAAVPADHRPMNERMGEVASITAAMSELGAQLSLRLRDLKPC